MLQFIVGLLGILLFTLAVLFDLGSAFAGAGLYEWKIQLRSAHV